MQGLLSAIGMGHQDLRRHRVGGLLHRCVGIVVGLIDGQQIGLIDVLVVLHHIIVPVGEHDRQSVTGTGVHCDADARPALVVNDLLQFGDSVVNLRTSDRGLGGFTCFGGS